MKSRNLLALVALMASGLAWADGHEAMAADEQAMMDAWRASGEMNEHHERLMSYAGEWEAKTKMWMDPSAPPMEATYTVTRTPSLGGRVIEEKWVGDFMGEEFVGLARVGYDNIANRYWSTWTDNMSTSLMTSYGSYDEDMEAVVMYGEAPDPMTGNIVRNKAVIHHASENEEMFVMYEMRGGQEVKTMEAQLTRK